MGITFFKLGICAALAMCASAFTVSAQTVYLLDENFNGNWPPKDWTIQNSTEPGAVNHWEQYTDTRTMITSAHVKDGDYSANEPVKEEILITPKVTLDGYYDLQFTWEGATAQSIAKLPNPQYDFQVRIKVDGSDEWVKIFSFLEEDLVRNAGVAYPWSAWVWNPSSINLTEWSGKTVQFAFVHCKLAPGSAGNDIWVDDVKIVSSKQITGPVAEVNPTSYIFPTTYIGAKKYSDPITLKNTGRDVLTVTGVSGLDGTDFGSTIDPASVSLKTGDTYQFQFWYEPTINGGARTTATIKTNGGDINVDLSGTKKALQGGVYEGFEGDVFPPLGWTRSNNNWYQYGAGLTGDHSAVCVFPDAVSDLVSPRLDLRDGNQALQFTFFESYDPQFDDSYGPENFFRVYLSTNGKASWVKVFDSSDDIDLYSLNEQHSVTLDLNGQGSDNCYIKFTSELPGFSMTDYDEIPDYSLIFVDDVVLPALYGSSDAPSASKAVSPKDGEENVYNKNVTLEWSGELFATNYKLYVGKSATSFDVINGQDMGTTTSYTIPRLDYATKYYWKVVGYNGNVANNPATWSFTTIPDQTVSSLPYSTNFDDGFPLGWNPTKDQHTSWSLSDYGPYGGTGKTPMASGYEEGTVAYLETPDFKLPSDEQILASFVWGNAAPVGLMIDSSGTRVNNTKEPGKQCTIYFDIEVDGQWKQLGMLHEEGETKYWYRESFDLTPYAGKTVAFRWRYEVYNYMAAAASVDNFLIQTASSDSPMVAFSADSWDAGYVNNGKSVTTRNALLLQNIGLETLKVKATSFGKTNFSTDLSEGTEIPANRSTAFNITYDAGTDEGEVNDTMTVTFDNGQNATFPVKGTTLASDIYYYDFEADEHTSTQPNDFVTIDRDGYATVMPVLIYYEKRGAPFAYIVLNITGPYADWRNVYPVSGEQVLASMSESTSTMETDDWIVSPKMTATSQSNFRFYAKCYGDADQVFSQNRLEVLVSTEGDRIDKNSIPSFETVLPSQKIPWSGSAGTWTEYNVDLSKYAGQEIWIALRHTTDRDGFVSFFDDFWFEHFTSNTPSGIQDITIVPAEGPTELYNLNGIRVDARNATPGIYILRNGEKTQKVIIR